MAFTKPSSSSLAEPLIFKGAILFFAASFTREFPGRTLTVMPFLVLAIVIANVQPSPIISDNLVNNSIVILFIGLTFILFVLQTCKFLQMLYRFWQVLCRLILGARAPMACHLTTMMSTAVCYYRVIAPLHQSSIVTFGTRYRCRVLGFKLRFLCHYMCSNLTWLVISMPNSSMANKPPAIVITLTRLVIFAPNSSRTR